MAFKDSKCGNFHYELQPFERVDEIGNKIYYYINIWPSI